MEKGTVLLERGEGASAKVKLGKKRRQQLKKRLDLERERLVKVEELKRGFKKEKEKLMMEEELKRGKEEKKKLVDEEDSNSKRMIGDGDCWGSTTLSQEARANIDSRLKKIEGFEPVVKDGDHYRGFSLMSPRDLSFKELVLAEGPYSNKTIGNVGNFEQPGGTVWAPIPLSACYSAFFISKVDQAKIDANAEKIRDSEGFDAHVMADVPNYQGIRLMTPSHFFHEQTKLLSYSNTAIATYNTNNNTNLEVVQLVKATYNFVGYLREYYITFTAKPKDEGPKDEGDDATPWELLWEILKGYSPKHPLYQARVVKDFLDDALEVKLVRPAPHTFPYLPIPPP